MMVEFNVLEKITEENRQLREALEYYADPANWNSKHNIARDDRGEAARRVLNETD